MSVGFGFSAGDFIAAIQLVASVIDALREVGGAGDRFHDLVRELSILQHALERVQALTYDESQHFGLVALYQAAAQCQLAISDFWKKVSKSQPHLKQGGSDSKFKDGWMKVWWTVCKKKDVERFRVDLRAHTCSILVLLGALQYDSTVLQSRKQENDQKMLLGHIQHASVECMGRLAAVEGATHNNAVQNEKIMDIVSMTMQKNLEVFKAVYDVQNIVKAIPNQISGPRPVHMIDALGRSTPFTLDLIDSADVSLSRSMTRNQNDIKIKAFSAVMKAKLRTIFSGPPNIIESGEFRIQDLDTNKDVNLKADWKLCFSPGQRVEMSVSFVVNVSKNGPCPYSQSPYEPDPNSSGECPLCYGLLRTIVKIFTVRTYSKCKVLEDSATQSYKTELWEGPEPRLALTQGVLLNQVLSICAASQPQHGPCYVTLGQDLLVGYWGQGHMKVHMLR
ncbi:hypothetical protein MMC17_005456 [Xylographa soralifera]|nr:hypothetical protein [Xylographa soralifera]